MRTFFSHKEIAYKKIKLPVSHKGQCTEAEYVIVKPNVLVTLSDCVAERLGLISTISSIDASGCNQHQEFEDVFQGLVVRKGLAYHIQLKPAVQGTAKPATRVAVALQDSVKAEPLKDGKWRGHLKGN